MAEKEKVTVVNEGIVEIHKKVTLNGRVPTASWEDMVFSTSYSKLAKVAKTAKVSYEFLDSDPGPCPDTKGKEYREWLVKHHNIDTERRKLAGNKNIQLGVFRDVMDTAKQRLAATVRDAENSISFSKAVSLYVALYSKEEKAVILTPEDYYEIADLWSKVGNFVGNGFNSAVDPLEETFTTFTDIGLIPESSEEMMPDEKAAIIDNVIGHICSELRVEKVSKQVIPVHKSTLSEVCFMMGKKMISYDEALEKVLVKAGELKELSQELTKAEIKIKTKEYAATIQSGINWNNFSDLTVSPPDIKMKEVEIRKDVFQEVPVESVVINSAEDGISRILMKKKLKSLVMYLGQGSDKETEQRAMDILKESIFRNGILFVDPDTGKTKRFHYGIWTL